jgi:hypothetical protein
VQLDISKTPTCGHEHARSIEKGLTLPIVPRLISQAAFVRLYVPLKRATTRLRHRFATTFPLGCRPCGIPWRCTLRRDGRACSPKKFLDIVSGLFILDRRALRGDPVLIKHTKAPSRAQHQSIIYAVDAKGRRMCPWADWVDTQDISGKLIIQQYPPNGYIR